MGRYLFYLVMFYPVFQSIGQYGSQIIVSTNADLALAAIPYDMDKDGDNDIISASAGDTKIVWFENLDGLGTFGEEQIIYANAVSILSLELYDINGDSSMDIVFHNNVNDGIYWMENIDDQGNFSNPITISEGRHPYSIELADFDLDGDLDLVSSQYVDQFTIRVVWYENLDGLGSFSLANIIFESIFYYYYGTVPMDVDSDGDLDILCSEEFLSNSTFVWFENDGTGSFPTIHDFPQFIPLSSDFTRIGDFHPIDLDNDGILDILYRTANADTNDFIKWMKGIDGQGTLSEPMIIYSEFYGYYGAMNTYDLDSDGDTDILLAKYLDSEVYWIENTDGLGTFGPLRLITAEVDRATDARAADLNNDGFLDIITASSFDDKIAWYPFTGLGQDTFEQSTIKIAPNPTLSNIELYHNNGEIILLNVYDVQGKIVPVKWDDNMIYTDILPAGLYLIRIEMESGMNQSIKLLKE